MITEDAFNAVPADAACEKCRHFARSAKTGKCYCEFLDRYVKPSGWCQDYQVKIDDFIRFLNSVENH